MKKQNNQKPSFNSLFKSQKRMLDKIAMVVSSLKDNYANAKFLEFFQSNIVDFLSFLEINLTHDRTKEYCIIDYGYPEFWILQQAVLLNLERINQLMNKIKESDYDVLYYLEALNITNTNIINNHIKAMRT